MPTRPLPLNVPGVPPAACRICAHGCSCPFDAAGCGHYGCRGRGAQDCPVAEERRTAYEARLAATIRTRAVLAARRTAWRTGAPS